MKKKDILCLFLLLFLIYRLLKTDTIESLNITGTPSQRNISSQEYGEVVPVQHSRTSSR